MLCILPLCHMLMFLCIFPNDAHNLLIQCSHIPKDKFTCVLDIDLGLQRTEAMTMWGLTRLNLPYSDPMGLSGLGLLIPTSHFLLSVAPSYFLLFALFKKQMSTQTTS